MPAPKTPVIKVGEPLSATPETLDLVTKYVMYRDRIAALTDHRDKIKAALVDAVQNNNGLIAAGAENEIVVKTRTIAPHVKRVPSYTALKQAHPHVFESYSRPNRSLKITGLTYEVTPPVWPPDLRSKIDAYEDIGAELAALKKARGEVAEQIKNMTPDTGAFEFTDGITVRFQNAARVVDWDRLKLDHPDIASECTVEQKNTGYTVPLRGDENDVRDFLG